MAKAEEIHAKEANERIYGQAKQTIDAAVAKWKKERLRPPEDESLDQMPHEDAPTPEELAKNKIAAREDAVLRKTSEDQQESEQVEGLVQQLAAAKQQVSLNPGKKKYASILKAVKQRLKKESASLGKETTKPKPSSLAGLSKG